MTILARVLGFSVALILAFAGVAYVLPQMEGAAPEQTTVNVGELTIESFVAMGRELYGGNGTCSLCHNELGRAPDLLALNVTQLALERIADPGYQGGAGDVEEYLRESMLQPSRYVVAGFGTKGSNDTESPMPAVDKAPIQLSGLAIDAIIAFLQDKDGNPVTVALPEATPADESVGVAAPAALPQTAEEAIAKFGCAACHAVLGGVATLGPSLDDIASRRSAEQIRESIVSPAAVVEEGYLVVMPAFPNMTLGELELIVGFLVQQTDDQT